MVKAMLPKRAIYTLGSIFAFLILLLSLVGRASLALAASGDLDTTFGTGGITKTEFPVTVSSRGSATLIQPDGKVVIAGSVQEANGGSDFALVRYLTNGSLDASFGEGGKVTTDFVGDDSINAIAIQTDGKIVALGVNYYDAAAEGFAMSRYLSNGALDSSFGTGGKITTGFAGGRPSDLVIQPDGKIVVVGSTAVNGDFVLARFLSNGTLDTTAFGTSGRVTTDFDGENDAALAVAILPDGKIVAAGSSSYSYSGYFALARYLANGTLDTTFGAGGKVTTDFTGPYDHARALVIGADGKITLAGVAGDSQVTQFALARYLANGSPDSGFGDGGKVTTTFTGYNSSEANDLKLLSSGNILVVGSALGPATDYGSIIALARYQTNGSLDSNFGNGGQVTTNFGGEINAAQAVAIQTDGKVLVAGYVILDQTPFQEDITAVRYQANGTLDSSFGTSGRASTDFFVSNAKAHAIALQSDGKIVAIGIASQYCSSSCSEGPAALARYLPNGSLDPQFGSGGKVSTGEMAEAYGLAIQPDGKIVVSGSAGGGTEAAFAVARYLPNGSLDTSFDDDGIAITNVNDAFRDAAFTLALQPDGKIIAAGYSSNGDGLALVRYLSNGMVDTSFGYKGIVRTQVNDNDAFAFTILVQPDGKVVVGGATERSCAEACINERFVVVRYMANGQPDPDFGTGGIVVTEMNSLKHSRVYGIKLQNDGKLVATGPVGLGCYGGSCGDSQADIGLVRYLPNGTLDASFGTGGKVITDFSTRYDVANALTIQADGRIVVVGASLDFVDNKFVVARYLSNGNLDNSFGVGGKVFTKIGLGGEANGVVIDSAGKIVIGGDASLGNGEHAFVVARYLSGGPPPATSTPLTATNTPISSPTPAPPTTTPTPCTANVYGDVPPDSTFYPYVTCLSTRGIIGGYSDCTFRPNASVTRGQLSKIVANAAGFNEPTSNQMFEDVPPSNSFYTFVGRMAQRGIIGGYPCGGTGEPCGTANLPYFRPNANATRGQISKIVSEAKGYSDTPADQMFEDVPVGNTFYLWVQRLASRGIMGGYPCGTVGEPCGSGTLPYFRPNNNATRGQVSKIVANTFFPSCATSGTIKP